MPFRLTVLLATAFVSQVLSHGIIGEFITDGIRNNGFPTDAIYRIQNGNPIPDIAAWSTEAVDRGYIEPNNVGTLDIVCHKNAVPGVLTAEVTAGGNVDFVWPDWPHNIGPVLTYIASCNGDCASADKSILKWVKIDEAGYDGTWAGQKLMDNNFTWTTTVPSTIVPGNYVFRNEIINLHDGALRNGAQLYPQCMNIRIVGSGTDSPDGLLGTELYKVDDTGILFDPYAKIINYTPPGPPLYSPSGLSIPVQTSAISVSGSIFSTSEEPASATSALTTSILHVTVAPSATANSTLDPAPLLTTLATRTHSRLSVLPPGASDSATVPLYGK
jgi:cellulase